MTLPVIGCRVAFGSNPFDPALVWTEIGQANSGTGDVRRAKTKRGRERLLRSTAVFQAGTADIGLRNLARNYDPTNAAGTHYPNVQPEKVIQLYAVWAGVEYVIWTGYADDWAQNWPGFAEGDVAVVATDLFKSLAIKRMWGTSYLSLIQASNPTTILPPPVGGKPWPGSGPIPSGTALPITFRCSSAGTNGASSGWVSIEVPPTVKVGDYMLAFITTTGAAGYSVTTPAGWTLIRTDVSGGANLVQEAAFGKVAVAGDIGAIAQFPIVGAPAVDATGALAVYYNVDPLNPVNASAAKVSGGVIVRSGLAGYSPSNPANTDVAVPFPAVPAGAYEFMFLVSQGAGGQTINAAAGWARLAQVQGVGSTVPLGVTMAVCGRLVPSDEGATTHHFTLFNSAQCAAQGGWLLGVDPTTPVPAGGVVGNGSPAASSAISNPGVAVGPLGGLVLVASYVRNATADLGIASTGGLPVDPNSFGGNAGAPPSGSVTGFDMIAPGGASGAFTDTPAVGPVAWAMMALAFTSAVPAGDNASPLAPAVVTTNPACMIVEGYAAQSPVAGPIPVFGAAPATIRETVGVNRLGQRVSDQPGKATMFAELASITPAGGWVAQTVALMPQLAP